MRIRRYDLLAQGLRAPADEEEAPRDAVHDLPQGVGALHAAGDRVGADTPFDRNPGVAPAEQFQGVADSERVPAEQDDGVADGRAQVDARGGDCFGDGFQPPEPDAEAADGVGIPGAEAFDEKCKAMLAFVHEHYAEPLRIEQIAAAGFCSQREAFRTFQQCLHVTPLNYLQSYRLQMAADRLVRSGQQITAIAVDCGFASLSYFGKVFRQKFGCTPAQFRSKWQDITNTGR